MVLRVHCPRAPVWMGLAALCLSGCSTLFDAPQGTPDALAGLSDKALSDVQAIAKGQAQEAMGTVPSLPSLDEMGQAATQAASQAGGRVLASMNSAKVTRLSPVQAKEPAIYFEKISNQMPQLVLLSTGNASVWWNDKPLLVPEGNASHVFLVPAGQHALRVQYPGAEPFLANVVVARYERVTLRVDAAAPTISKNPQ